MSLDVSLKVVRPVEIYAGNITHNLNKMAMEAGLYECMWRPEECGITKAEQMIGPLTVGLETLKADPEKYSALNPPNGWGSYERLVAFVEAYLRACGENPEADVSAWRGEATVKLIAVDSSLIVARPAWAGRAQGPGTEMTPKGFP